MLIWKGQWYGVVRGESHSYSNRGSKHYIPVDHELRYWKNGVSTDKHSGHPIRRIQGRTTKAAIEEMVEAAKFMDAAEEQRRTKRFEEALAATQRASLVANTVVMNETERQFSINPSGNTWARPEELAKWHSMQIDRHEIRIGCVRSGQLPNGIEVEVRGWDDGDLFVRMLELPIPASKKGAAYATWLAAISFPSEE